MSVRYCLVTATVVGSLLAPRAALGEAPASKEGALPAPDSAYELSLATGYTQGFGMVVPGVGMPSVAGAGIAAEIGVGYRLDPAWGFGLAAQYEALTPGRAEAAHGAAGILAVHHHLAPLARFDPWIEGGAGYRFIVESNRGADVVSHGFEVARLRLGLDTRTTVDVAVAPFIGADATVFTWHREAASTVGVSTFVFAGVQGRLDLGGARISPR